MFTETVKPDPDSQYRLVPCKCGGEPFYRHWFGAEGEYWRAECPKCGRRSVTRTIRHEVQIDWNMEMKGGVKSGCCD